MDDSTFDMIIEAMYTIRNSGPGGRDLRFMQLLSNAGVFKYIFGSDDIVSWVQDPYYMEDKYILKKLEEYNLTSWL